MVYFFYWRELNCKFLQGYLKPSLNKLPKKKKTISFGSKISNTAAHLPTHDISRIGTLHIATVGTKEPALLFNQVTRVLSAVK